MELRRGALLTMVVVGLLGAGCSGSDNGSGGTGADAVDETTTRPAAVPGENVAVPTVTGPITGGRYDRPFNAMPAQLADQYGYTEEEFFVGGTATAYEAEGAWGSDGHWDAVAATTAPYTTRIVVRRPIDPERFDGTVVIEWLNVTAGMDADPDFGQLYPELLEHGSVYVGVSAQAVGIVGGSAAIIDVPGIGVTPLQTWDPDRYGALEHPGDQYSYDIFSQAAQAIRRPEGVDPLEGLDVERVLAVGESQSAIRLVTYVNAVQPLGEIYDGFLIHSRGGGGAPIGTAARPEAAGTDHIRTDLDQPVLQFETETDLVLLGFADARQPDTDEVRTWEVAGTAHADQGVLDYGTASGREWSGASGPDFTALCGPVNTGPQGPVVRRALQGLRTWVADGTPPAHGSPIEMVDGTEIARDEYGNALRGVRTPAVDAPIATLTGINASDGGVVCLLFGSTIPFDEATLRALYPTHEDYVDAVRSSATEAVEAGFLLAADAERMVEGAAGVPG